MRLDNGDQANVSRIDCNVHAGTHIDAPQHYLENGDTVDQVPLDVLMGPAIVAFLPKASVISADTLASINLPEATKRLLLRTRNSELWATGVIDFRKDYVALTSDAAQWLVDHDIKLVGIDYLSIQAFHDGPLTHKILLKANVIILEGLNLAAVHPGRYDLICLPIRLVGAEGAPARAILRDISIDHDLLLSNGGFS
jgi:arylformamidase